MHCQRLSVSGSKSVCCQLRDNGVGGEVEARIWNSGAGFKELWSRVGRIHTTTFKLFGGDYGSHKKAWDSISGRDALSFVGLECV